nr:MAG TPA: hypothetical protein [Caudoviricetes sp.]
MQPKEKVYRSGSAWFGRSYLFFSPLLALL